METLFAIEQKIYHGGGGVLSRIEQVVELRLSGGGRLIEIEQTTDARASGPIFKIEQRITSPDAGASSVEKYGFDCSITIGGESIPSNKIHGLINISRAENSAAIADFQIIPDPGQIDLNRWRGKPVLIDVETTAGIQRIFTGIIDIPEIDLVNGILLFRCTNRRNEQINKTLSRSQLNRIGRWHTSIFEDADDFADELKYRLRTTAQSVDFDPYGRLFISDFLPKNTPDFTLSGSDIYRRQPTLEVASRGRLINRVNLDFVYSYVRLRHRTRKFELSGPDHCEVVFTNGLSFLTRDGIATSILGFSWAVQKGSITFENIPPDGRYCCDIILDNLAPGVDPCFNWRVTTKTSDIVAKVDENCQVVKDSSGNQINEAKNIKIVDSSILYALSASWRASKGFAQDIEQEYLITITAPQSIAQYGEIEQNQSNGHLYDYDSTDFERTKKFAVPDGFLSGGEDGKDFFKDEKGEVADFNSAYLTAVNIAQTTIKKSHRENHVTLERSIWPEIDLRHTVKTESGLINAIGKVTAIQHTIDINKRFAETTVKISFSQSIGSATDSPIITPTNIPEIRGGATTDTIKIDVYETDKNGKVVNNPEKLPGLTSPDIDDLSRDKHEIKTSSSLIVEIKNDNLVVTL